MLTTQLAWRYIVVYFYQVSLQFDKIDDFTLLSAFILFIKFHCSTLKYTYTIHFNSCQLYL